MLFCIWRIFSQNSCNFWGHVWPSAFRHWYAYLRLAWYFRRFEDISRRVLVVVERKLLLDAYLIFPFSLCIERRRLNRNLLLPPFIDCTNNLLVSLTSWAASRSKRDSRLFNSSGRILWRIKISCLRWFLEDNNLFSLSICYISRLVNEGFTTFESWFKIHFILINY